MSNIQHQILLQETSNDVVCLGHLMDSSSWCQIHQEPHEWQLHQSSRLCYRSCVTCEQTVLCEVCGAWVFPQTGACMTFPVLKTSSHVPTLVQRRGWGHTMVHFHQEPRNWIPRNSHTQEAIRFWHRVREVAQLVPKKSMKTWFLILSFDIKSWMLGLQNHGSP